MVALQVAEGEVETQREASREQAQALSRLREEYYALRQTHGELSTRLEEKEASFRRQLAWMEESKQQLKVEFENLANELLEQDRKSTRLNSSHVRTSYAVFCLKKKNMRRSDRRGVVIAVSL